MNLVYLDGKKQPYTTSEIVAECAEVKHHAIHEHIRKHFDELENFGKLSFEMRPLPSGQKARFTILTNSKQPCL